MNEYRHHRYTWTKPFGNEEHCWELIGPKGALHFHVTILDEKYGGAGAGLEIHYREAPKHMRGEAPSQLGCKLTGGWCWHDGSSLYATETLWPVVKGLLERGSHEAIFRMLEGEATRHFNEDDEEAEA